MKHKQKGWYFPIDDSDQWDGFNEPGIEHFRGSPIVHLAREINQNSLDARMTSPVMVKFSLEKVPTKTIPDLQQLNESVEAARKSADEESHKARVFFDNARKALKNKRLPVLIVHDWNTSGLQGPCTNGTPYYAFMKAEGQSKKQSETAGGSYGIGKYAPYAVSALRTVFVSTNYEDDEGVLTRLTQAKSVLMSHDIDGKRHRGVGFWGYKTKCAPIEGRISEIPSWLVPNAGRKKSTDQLGTTLGILGFNTFAGWERLLIAAIAENFFAAIANGDLVVDVASMRRLDHETIADTLNAKDYRSSIKDEKGEPERFDNAGLYLEALTNRTETISAETENRDLGWCRLKILVREEAPKRVAILRNGMFITDQLDRLKRFSEFKDFIAVVECLSDKGNALLRDMEPPRHDDFEPMRLATSDERTRGTRALRELAEWVREMLKRYAKDPVTEVTTIDELSQYFGDDTGGEEEASGDEVNPEGGVMIRAKPVSRLPVIGRPERSGQDGSDDGDVDGEGPGTADGSGQESGDGKSGGVGVGRQAVPLANVRAVPLDRSVRRIAFTPGAAGKIRLVVEESGADADFPIRIVDASLGTVVSGGIEIEVERDTRYVVTTTIEEAFEGALRVLAYEV